MKKNIRLMLVAILAISISLTSCKKDNDTKDNTDLATHSEDQSEFASNDDDVINDANNVIDDNPAFNGRPGSASNLFLPCNADIVLDSTATLRRLRITYHGNNCNNTRTRNGVVTLTMPLTSHWADQDAVLTIETTNLVITRISDTRSITINGTQTITNVTGGRIWDLASTGTIIHDIASPGIDVAFENGTHRTWQVSKKRTFTYNNGIVITTIGTHSQNGVDNISEWGTNRFGSAFTSAITQPMTIRQDCNFRLVSGEIAHAGGLGSVVVTFGLDATGNPVTTCPAGPFYFKAVWTGNNGNVRVVIRPYN